MGAGLTTPSGISVSVVNPNQINITVTYPAGYDYDALTIERDGVPILVLTSLYTLYTHQDTTAQDGTSYVYRVKASYLGVDSSYVTAAAQVTPLWDPSEPSGSAASGTEITARWRDNSQNESEFKIYVDGVYNSSVGQNVTEKALTGLTPNIYYTIEISAANAITESGKTSAIQILTGDPPAAPYDPTATSTATTKVRVNFKRGSSNESGFHVERSPAGAATWTTAGTLGPGVLTFEDTGLTSNTAYDYRVHSWNASGDSAYSATVTVTTMAAIAKPGLAVTPWGSGRIECVLQDRSELETDHRLERRLPGFVIEKVTDGGMEDWASATDLTSWTEVISGTCTINRSTDKSAGSYACRIDYGAEYSDVRIYQDITLVSGASYVLRVWYKNSVAGKAGEIRLRDSSSSQNLKSDGTWQAGVTSIALPNSLTWAMFELSFAAHASYTAYRLMIGNPLGTASVESSSFYIDSFSILGEDAFAEIATLAPNREFYPNTGLTAGQAYEYRARARQSGSPDVYSAYSDIVSATALSTPAAPTSPAIDSYDADWIKFTWVKSAGGGETGYIIEMSTDSGANWVELWRTPAGAQWFIKRGLTPSTRYDFRFCAYNAAGSSAYAASINQTTRAAHELSDFEVLCRDPQATFRLVMRLSPKLQLQGFALTSGRTYTYQLAVDERGIDFFGVYANGSTYSEKTSISDVEASASTWYFDYWNRLLYIHMAGGDAPGNYYVDGAFWVYATNRQDKDAPVIVDGNYCLQLFSASGIPELAQEITRLAEGAFVGVSGSITLDNPENEPGEHFWDKRYQRWIFENRPIEIRAGSAAWTDFSKFKIVASGIVRGKGINETGLTLDLGDLRDGLDGPLPESKYSATDYALLDSNGADRYIPLAWGTIGEMFPVCIDTTNRKYKFADHRVKSVTSVTRNGTTLTVNTDYFVDYQRGQIEMASGLGILDSDTIKVAFHGAVNSADEELNTAAKMYVDLLMTHRGLTVEELDLDSIYQTASSKTQTIGALISEETQLRDIVRRLEFTAQASTFQTPDGLMGLMPEQTAARADIKYVGNHMTIGGLSAWKAKDDVNGTIRVYYGEIQANSEGQRWVIVESNNPSIYWAYRYKTWLDVYTYLTTEADAQALLAALDTKNDLDRYELRTGPILMTERAGGLFYLNRDRFFDLTGTAGNKLMRIRKISPSFAARRCGVIAEVVE